MKDDVATLRTIQDLYRVEPASTFTETRGPARRADADYGVTIGKDGSGRVEQRPQAAEGGGIAVWSMPSRLVPNTGRTAAASSA